MAPISPQVTWMTIEYNTEHVTVALERQKEAGASYNVTVIPNPLRLSENMNQLTIQYFI